jgi:hypothetical protein
MVSFQLAAINPTPFTKAVPSLLFHVCVKRTQTTLQGRKGFISSMIYKPNKAP